MVGFDAGARIEAVRHHIGLVLQGHFDEQLTAEENLRFHRLST